ncbi:HTH-type transcriptional regulator SgrR [Streptomyces tendae]
MERTLQGRTVDRSRPSRRHVLRTGGLLLGALSAPALLSACGTTAAADRAGNVLRVSQPGDPKTLDPQKQGDMVSMNVLINMFDTLTTRGRDNRLHPRLALTWKATDAHTWRFTLRPGVTFHNGEVCDARAVAFSIERLLDPATKSPIVELRFVKGVTVVDRLTVDLHTTVHDPILPAKLSLFGGVVVPPRHLAEVGDAAFADHPVGTGPFTFTSWQRDHELRMRAYDDHWNGRPAVDGLVFSPAPNASSSLAALQSGGVDLVAGLTPDAAQQLEGYGGVTIDGHTGIRTAYLSLNTLERGPLQDRRVRQALNHAVDVPLLIKAVLGGKATETPALVPRSSSASTPPSNPSPAPSTPRDGCSRSRSPARLLHHAHRLQHRRQRRRGPVRAPRQGRGGRPRRPARPRHLLRPPHLRQPRCARPDLPRGQHRVDDGRREHRPVQRAQRPPPEPLALRRGRPPHRRRGTLRGPRLGSAVGRRLAGNALMRAPSLAINITGDAPRDAGTRRVPPMSSAGPAVRE